MEKGEPVLSQSEYDKQHEHVRCDSHRRFHSSRPQTRHQRLTESSHAAILAELGTIRAATQRADAKAAHG